MSFDAVFGELFPGSLTASFLGAAWAFLLAFLLGAALWPRLAEPSSREHDVGQALLSWWLLGMAMMGPIVLALSAFSLMTSRALALTCASVTIACAALAGRRLLTCALRAVRGIIAEARDGGGATRLGMLALGGVLALTTLVASVPSVYFDDLVYHLGLPRQALILGAWPTFQHFHHSLMPAAWEAAQALPLAIGGGGGPQLMNAGVLALVAAATLRLARRAAPAWAAWLATALILASPLFMELGSLAGNDLVVGLGLLVGLEALLTRASAAQEPPASVSLLVVAGLAGGMASAAKFTGLLGLGVLCAAAFLWERGSLRKRLTAAIIIAALALLLASPWLLRATLLTGNPVYPAAESVLGHDAWDDVSAQLLTRDSSQGAFPTAGLSALATAFVALVHGGKGLGDPSGIMPLLAPLLWLIAIMLAVRHEASRRLMTYTILAYLAWCATSLMERFFLPPILVLAFFLAMSLGIAERWLARRGMTRPDLVLGVAGLLAVVGAAAWSADASLVRLGPDTTWREALSRTDVLFGRLQVAQASRAMAMRLPQEARLLVVGESRLALMPRSAEINTAIDAPLIAELLAGCEGTEDVNARLRGRVTHVLVGYRELTRLEREYRLAERLGPERMALLKEWLGSLEPLGQWGEMILYEVPQGP